MFRKSETPAGAGVTRDGWQADRADFLTDREFSRNRAIAVAPPIGTAPIGSLKHYRGQTFIAVGWRVYTRSDGTPSAIVTWACRCLDCGDRFLQTTGRSFPRYPTRRCKAHRRRFGARKHEAGVCAVPAASAPQAYRMPHGFTVQFTRPSNGGSISSAWSPRAPSPKQKTRKLLAAYCAARAEFLIGLGLHCAVIDV